MADFSAVAFSYVERRIIMKCVKGHTVFVLSAHMYYIGTIDEDKLPHCRISEEYYESYNEAEAALENHTFTMRNCLENNFCRGNRACVRMNGGGERL